MGERKRGKSVKKYGYYRSIMMFTYVLDNLLFTTNNKNVRKISLHQIIIIIENYWLDTNEKNIFPVLWHIGQQQHTLFLPHLQFTIRLIGLHKWENKEMEKKNKNYNTLVRSELWIKWNFHAQQCHALTAMVIAKKSTSHTHSHSTRDCRLKMKPTPREPDEIRKKYI